MTGRDTSEEPPQRDDAMGDGDTEHLREYALLISNLLHDLRSPLGSIAGGASVLDQYADKLDGPAKSRVCDGIIEQTRRLDTLFTALAALARARTGTLQRETGAVELNELLRGVWTVDPNSSGLPGATSLLREEVFLRTDPAAIRIMLTLMLGLAALFSPDDGEPVLLLALKGTKAVITIECGIHDDGRVRLEKLLEGRCPGVRSNPDAKADAICLAAIQEVVHSLGGNFDILHNDADGRLRQTVSLRTVNVPKRAG